MDNKKRVLTACLCSFYIVSSVLTSYVTVYAAAIPIVYSSWEVWEMIFLSLGITLDLADKDISEEFAGEMKDCFDLWVDSNTIDDSTKQWYKDTMSNVIEQGKTGVITISNELWNTLKGWASNLSECYGKSNALTSNEMMNLLSNAKVSGDGGEQFLAALNDAITCGFTFIIIDNPINSRYMLIRTSDYAYPDGDYRTSSGYYELEYRDSKWTKIPTYIYLTYGGVYGMVPHIKIPCCEGDKILVHNSKLAEFADVIFPEEDLAYDICYLPGYDLSATYANGAYDVVTSGRTWDGADVAGDVVITMPDELTTDIPFQDLYDKVVAGDIPFTDVLDDVGVIPVDTTLDRDLVGGKTIAGAIVDTAINNAPTIDDAKEETDENGQTVQKDIPMTFDLSKLFPFCIPFDIIDFLGVLSAKPVAPCIEWPIQYPTLNGMETYNLKIDLSEFDEIASLFRKMETLVFIVGLAGITRNHMIRG